MSTALFQLKADAFAAKQDALRDVFALDGVRCVLLKRGGQTQGFTQLTELDDGYYFKFDDNRSQGGLFRYATSDIDGFRDIWAECHAIGYGVPDSAGKIEVYEFAQDEKDIIDPDAASVYFAGRMIRTADPRFTLTPDIAFTGANIADANAVYRKRGVYQGKNYYVRIGKPDLCQGAVECPYLVNWNIPLMHWQQWDEAASQSWYRNPNDGATPDLGTWEVDESGTDPAPTVTPVPF